MKQIDPSEFIYVDSYQKIIEEVGPPLLWHSGYSLTDLFKEERGSTVLVTSICDCGPVEQAEHHPNLDLLKHYLIMDIDDVIRKTPTDKYGYVQIGPAAETGCVPTHKYGMKTERWTWNTFDEIPGWVTRWFTVNCSIWHEKVTWIPFGLNNHGHGSSLIAGLQGTSKTKLCYLNFQDYSVIRTQLKMHYKGCPWITFVPQSNLPVEQFLADIASHKFVLCPMGNGLDSYRVYETIYLGGIPVLEKSRFTEAMENYDLPVLTVDSLFNIQPEKLEEYWEFYNEVDWNYEPLTLSYWRKKIEEAACESH